MNIFHVIRIVIQIIIKKEVILRKGKVLIMNTNDKNKGNSIFHGLTSENEKNEHEISCEVNNCEYHCNTNCCSAKKIKVGPTHAISPADTVCSTFKSK